MLQAHHQGVLCESKKEGVSEALVLGKITSFPMFNFLFYNASDHPDVEGLYFISKKRNKAARYGKLFAEVNKFDGLNFFF